MDSGFRSLRARRVPAAGMGTRVLWLLLSASLLFCTSASAELRADGSRDVGFGFRVVTKSGVVSPNAWEVGHFGFLYYMETELAQIGTYSIAPSGKYALYQDPAGAVTLFSVVTTQRRLVAKPRRSVAEDFVWHEAKGFAVIAFEDRSAVRISLSSR
jgi:hypothetical protein